jgi:hypothetical protein
MRDIERKAWSETASLYLQKVTPQLQEIAASLVGFGDILSHNALTALGKDLLRLSVQLGGEGLASESVRTEETEATQSLARGISLAQSSEDLKRCADVLRSWHLPKGHHDLRRFSRMLLARAEELGLDFHKTHKEIDPNEQPQETVDGYPRIINPPRASQRKPNNEKSRREVFESLVKTGKRGLSVGEHEAIDTIAAQLLSCQSIKDLDEVKRGLSTFTLSMSALQQVADLIDMRVGHIKESSWEGKP